MALRVCAEPGCPTLVTSGKCGDCRRKADRARGTKQARGYDAAHDRLGHDYQRRMDDGERFDCWRCGRQLGTRRGIDWQLGHDDHDRSKHRGPECPDCNLRHAGRKTHGLT